MTSAIVVARAGSKRLPRKALLPFAGLTLVGHKVRTLKACRSIHRVYIGSDSHEILSEGERHGAIAVQRDDFHCDESRCTANEMIQDMAFRVEGDLIVWAHPTNPLVKASTYDAAIAAYTAGLDTHHDSLVSVTRIQRHAWFNGKPFNYEPWSGRHQTAKELPTIDFQDGAIFIQPRHRMIQNSYFFGGNPVLFPIDPIEGWDIDTLDDYLRARQLHERPRIPADVARQLECPLPVEST